MATRPLPEGLDEQDWHVSATIRDLGQLDATLDALRRFSGGRRPTSVLDLGCGIGGLTRYVGERVGAQRLYGVDLDGERLARARERGLTTFELDLNRDPLPLDDASVGLVLSFGAFEHLTWYDNTISEAARVAEDGGWFLLSMPNLGSYVNRAALLFGYQPREVEVSWEAATGMLPFYRSTEARGAPLGHIHAATLRCMRGLLGHFGWETVLARGFSPDFGKRSLKVLDALFGRFPSLARRYIILARRTPRPASPAPAPSAT